MCCDLGRAFLPLSTIGSQLLRKSLTFLTLVLVASGTGLAAAAPLYEPATDAALSKTVLFVGDSNISRGATQITEALTNRANGYLPIFTPRGGMGIRGYKDGWCPTGVTVPCPAPDYWQIRLAAVLTSVHPDAIVINLGINDASAVGTPTSAGYGDYDAKISWLLAQLPPGVPVFWSGLPTPLEPRSLQVGAGVVNGAIARSGVHVLRWYAAAYLHPEYMLAAGRNVHYSPAGYAAWSAMVATALDAQP